MERKKIVITRKINFTGIDILKNYYDVIFIDKTGSPTKTLMMQKVKNVYGILCTLSERIDSDIMDAAGSNLKVIKYLYTGYDHIDIYAVTKRGIYVTNTGNVLSESLLLTSLSL